MQFLRGNLAFVVGAELREPVQPARDPDHYTPRHRAERRATAPLSFPLAPKLHLGVRLRAKWHFAWSGVSITGCRFGKLKAPSLPRGKARVTFALPDGAQRITLLGLQQIMRRLQCGFSDIFPGE